jgi:hypothetical protein
VPGSSSSENRFRPGNYYELSVDEDFRFYKLTPLLVKISRICDRVWSCVVNLPVWGLPSPTNEDFAESKNRIFTKYGTKSYADWFLELRGCLDDADLRAFIGRAAKDFQRAIDRLLNADSPKECGDAANLVYHWINDLENWVHEKRLEYFGEWGRRFMSSIIEEASEKEIDRFARQWGPLSHAGTSASPASAESSVDADGELNKSVPTLVQIKEKQFSVQVGNEECLLGNTKVFQFLLSLVKSPNQFINCRRLVDLMGDDSLSIGNLKQTKYLLVQALQREKCTALAGAIVSDKDHYGVFPEKHNLRIVASERHTSAFDQDVTAT